MWEESGEAGRTAPAGQPNRHHRQRRHDAEVFQAYVKQVPGLRLAPANIVVLDNLLAHKAAGIQQAMAWCRVRLRY
jgi:hypothetical protein